MRTVTSFITPQFAAKLLENNPTNRPMRQKHIENLAGAIKRGEWVTTHQGIAISTDGRLLDGQHRLWAIVEADQGVSMQVTYDAPLETYRVLDAGLKRSLTDQTGIARASTELVRFHMLVGSGNRYPTATQVQKEFAILEAAAVAVDTAVPGRKRNLTSAPIRYAVMLHWLRGGAVRDHAMRQFHSFALENYGELVPATASFMKQMHGVQGQMAGRGENERILLAARALRAFALANASVTKVTVRDSSTAVEELRDYAQEVVRQTSLVRAVS